MEKNYHAKALKNINMFENHKENFLLTAEYLAMDIRSINVSNEELQEEGELNIYTFSD